MDNKIDKILNLIVQNIKTNFEKCKYEKTVQLIGIYASIMYLYNQLYTNIEIEEMFYATVNKMYKKSDLTKEELDKTRIVFYDGFGLDNRGLIQIYLKALNWMNVPKSKNVDLIFRLTSGKIEQVLNNSVGSERKRKWRTKELTQLFRTWS